MEKAKLDLENQQCYELVHGNEIIVIDDTDSDGDGTEPLGSNKLSITVFNTGVALDSEYIPQPNVSNDLVTVQSSSPVIDDGIIFWEGVIASENDNDVKDDEHSDEMDLDIPMSQNISQLQQNGTTNVDDANSSTDSTPDLDEESQQTNTPNSMLEWCFSSNCQWRVYATKLKYSDVSEIRKLDPIHTCSADDRSGYQSQVTHHVVGEMMKARFNGSGGGPKPGEIRQVMQGDHDKRSPIPFAKASDRCKGRGGACDRLEKSWIKQKELYAQGRSSLDGFEVKKIKYLEYEVRNKEGCSFHVDISKRFCSCFEFQLLEIPCQHAIAAAIVAKVKVDSLVAEEYTKNAMVVAYTGSVAQVIDTDNIIELTAQLSELDMLPPSSRRPPGRPPKKCFISRGEVRTFNDGCHECWKIWNHSATTTTPPRTC
ncbi:hypothetical protein F2Q68_00020331 [Brassica cretica]|uniref:SWIM-type domain-containing protein n=1 Tax=Brassica cretica TaxID=69181 RepID=A0A8S9FVF8_BRACR|nr:hypothetical protein F2Q68_00020331 [Brassica cretica]